MSITVHRSRHTTPAVPDDLITTQTATTPAAPAAPAQDAAHVATRTRSDAHRDTDATALALLARLYDLPAGSPDRPRIRARVIELYLPMAEHLARRFRNRGEPADDLVQVACLGLVKAVDGFDPNRGAAFTSYAIPMIVGELKRHFRDKCWDVRVPRRVQELRLQLTRATDELTQALGRSPTVADLAAHLQAGEEEVIEGLESANAYTALSLQTPAGSEDGDTSIGDLLGADDNDFDAVEVREALRPLLTKLPAREQRIIALRFYGNMTQSQIAAEMGISQMHVSRLLGRALTALRKGMQA